MAYPDNVVIEIGVSESFEFIWRLALWDPPESGENDTSRLQLPPGERTGLRLAQVPDETLNFD
jgi:hypothetical protein